MEEHLWRYKDVCQYLNMPLGSAYALVCQGRIPHLRLSGRSVRFDPAEVKKWLEEKRCGTAGSAAVCQNEEQGR